MRHNLHWKLGAVTLLGSGAALVAFMALEREPEEARETTVEVAPAPEPRKEPDIIKDNARTILKLEDDRQVRKFAFEKVGERFAAEGVEVRGAGEVVFTSQVTGGSVTQRLVAAVVEGKRGEEPLAAHKDPVPTVTADDKKSRLRYPEFFAGLDLEYTYDGKDVEEFFHVREPLYERLQGTGEDLRVRALLPGLFLEKGALISGVGGTPLLDQPLDPPSPEEAASLGPKPLGAPITTKENVELNVDGHRFILPPAVAIDGKGEKVVLARTFRYGPAGIEVEVHVPGEWMQKAQAPVVIDPSIIDNTRGVQILTWNERNIVKDSTGRFHVTYMGIHNGRWHAFYTSGDGQHWDEPTLIANHGPGENTHYTPTLVIDSNDTLHALWGDWGYGPNNPDERGTYSSWHHRLHYAQCPNRCELKNWSFDGKDGGRILIGSASSHHMHQHMAVDGNDVVHIAFEERDPYRQRYFQVEGGVVTEKAGPGQNYHSSFLVVDNNNTVHYLGADYWNNRDVRHYTWNRAIENWESKQRFSIGYVSGCHATNYSQHRLNAVVDSNNYIHATLQAYDHWTCYTWMVGYGRYDPSTDSWHDVGIINMPDTANRYHEHVPSITVDDAGTVHVVWLVNRDPQRQILYAQKPANAGWSATTVLLRTTGTYLAPQIRPRLAYPVGPNNNVPAGLLDILVVENGNELRYVSTGAPVDGVRLLKPRDHTYLADQTPLFEWQRLASDDGSNTTYILEIDTTPLFNAPLVIDAGTTNSYTLSGVAPEILSDGAYYYWRLKARNTYGDGPYGPIYELGIDVTPPSPFNLIAPADGSDPGTKTPTFEWEAAAD